MEKINYVDSSSATPLDREVFESMQDYFGVEYGNPGSMHKKGLVASYAIDSSRRTISKILNCNPDEIIFTSSGTESINLALKGIAFQHKDKGNHIISTKIEHSAVINTLKYLEKKGFKISLVDVEKNGIVDVEKIKKEITKDTILISVMYANNEIGTIQPIKEIGKIAKESSIFFHCDACQAANSEDIDVNKLGVDLMTLNGSKIYGPKGIGCLYKKKDIEIEPLIHGGGQEFYLRGGTENVPAIVGFAKALKLAQDNKFEYTKKLKVLRDYLIQNLLKVENTILNGDPVNRLPNNVNISFLDVEGESILLKLDKEGICASSGSACTSKNLDPSHVILALGYPREVAHGSIRFSLNKYTTKKDIQHLIETIPKIIKDLREISPVKINLEAIKNDRR